MSDIDLKALREAAVNCTEAGCSGVFIDPSDALQLLDRLEAAEKERDELRASLAAEKTRLAMLAQIARHSAKQHDALVIDAQRYRWLRGQKWERADLFVIAGSKSHVRLGTDCPCDDRLDAAIDAAMAQEGGK